MNSVTNREENALSSFFGDFYNSVSKILLDNFDSDLYKDLKFHPVDNCFKEGVGELGSNSALLSLNFTVEDYTGPMIFIIPEELIALASNIMMGEDKADVYKGTLSELEINASVTIINSIYDSLKNTFKSIYMKDVIFNSDVELITKSNNEEKYNSILSDKSLNFSMIHSLDLTADKAFEVIFMFNIDSIKLLLTNLAILEQDLPESFGSLPSTNSSSNSDINHLKDIRITLDAELGRSKIPIQEVLSFVKGSIVELDAETDEDLRIFANGLEVARAKPVVLDDHLGIQITKIMSPEERYKKF